MQARFVAFEGRDRADGDDATLPLVHHSACDMLTGEDGADQVPIEYGSDVNFLDIDRIVWVRFSSRCRNVTPALWTRIEMGPSACFTSSTTRATSLFWVRSPRTLTVLTPYLVAIWFAVSVRVVPSRIRPDHFPACRESRLHIPWLPAVQRKRAPDRVLLLLPTQLCLPVHRSPY